MSMVSRVANSAIGVVSESLGSKGSTQRAALTNAYEVVGHKLDKMAHTLNTTTGEVEVIEEVELSHLWGSIVPHFSEDEVEEIKAHVTGMVEDRNLEGRVTVDVAKDRPIYNVDWDPAKITLAA